MEIKGNARRILKYLSERSEVKSFYPTSLYNQNHINVRSRVELDQEIDILYENGLIDKEGENIILNPTGKSFMEQIEREEDNEIYKDVFTNFKLALLKYFYSRNEPLTVDELPLALVDNVETHFQPNGTNAFNLMHYIEIVNRQYFNSKSHYYELNENGKRYLSHLLTEEEKNRIPIFSTINIHHQTGDNINIKGDGNTVIKDSSLDKSQVNPVISKENSPTTTNQKKNSWIEKTAWVVGIAAGLVAIYEFVIKRFL